MRMGEKHPVHMRGLIRRRRQIELMKLVLHIRRCFEQPAAGLLAAPVDQGERRSKPLQRWIIPCGISWIADLRLAGILRDAEDEQGNIALHGLLRRDWRAGGNR